MQARLVARVISRKAVTSRTGITVTAIRPIFTFYQKVGQ
jgi:hypothetical protein